MSSSTSITLFQTIIKTLVSSTSRYLVYLTKQKQNQKSCQSRLIRFAYRGQLISYQSIPCKALPISLPFFSLYKHVRSYNSSQMQSIMLFLKPIIPPEVSNLTVSNTAYIKQLFQFPKNSVLLSDTTRRSSFHHFSLGTKTSQQGITIC